MAKGAISFSSDNEYYTPKYVVDYFFPEGFDYDPATTKEKAEEMGCRNYDTIETDGLKRDWTMFERIWVNPPFTQKFLFLTKAIETYRKAHNTIFILLPTSVLTTCQFFDAGGTYTIYVPRGRIRFEKNVGGQLRSPAFGTVVLCLAEENSIKLIELRGETK